MGRRELGGKSTRLDFFGAVLGWVGSFLTQSYQVWLNRCEAERQQRLQAQVELRKIQLPSPEETRKISASRYGPLMLVAGAGLVAWALMRQLEPGVGSAEVGSPGWLLWLAAGFMLVFAAVETWRWVREA